MDINTPYKTITREQFLFHEMRITARLLNEGKTDEEIITEIESNNLFQFPTEKMIRNIARVCVKRLHALQSDELVEMIANGSVEQAKQACFYAMMVYYHLIWDFANTVIAEKYRTKDYSYTKRDLNSFFTRLQEQNDEVASWSESTIKKCKSVINSIIVEMEYIDSFRSETLKPVLIDLDLKNILLDRRDYASLAVFNCFEEV